MSRGVNAGNAGRGSHWIRDAKRKRIYERDNWRCVWCAHAVQSGATSRQEKVDRWVNGVRLATLDHVLPRSLGGCNSAHNLVTACSDCNEQRGDQSAIEFAWYMARAETLKQFGQSNSVLARNWGNDYACGVLDRVIDAMGRKLEPLQAPKRVKAA